MIGLQHMFTGLLNTSGAAPVQIRPRQSHKRCTAPPVAARRSLVTTSAEWLRTSGALPGGPRAIIRPPAVTLLAQGYWREEGHLLEVTSLACDASTAPAWGRLSSALPFLSFLFLRITLPSFLPSLQRDYTRTLLFKITHTDKGPKPNTQAQMHTVFKR